MNGSYLGRHRMRSFFLLVIASLLPLSLHAETFTLFSAKNTPVENYNEIVRKLQKGDEIRFSDGVTHKLGRLLGSGNTTYVFELSNRPTEVIRVPKIKEELRYIQATQNGYAELVRRQVPIVTIHNPGSLEYIIVDKLGSNTKDFDDLVANKVTPLQKKEMIQGLKDFAKRTAAFAYIGDLRPDQMVYDFDKKAWIVFDWTSAHFIARHDDLSTTADANFFLRYLTFNLGRTEATPDKPEYQWIADLWRDMKEIALKERGWSRNCAGKFTKIGTEFEY